MASEKNTMQATFTHMSDFTESGREMLPSELPFLCCGSMNAYNLFFHHRFSLYLHAETWPGHFFFTIMKLNLC